MGFFAAFLEQLKRFVLPEIIPGFYSQQGSKVEKTNPPEFFISFLGSRDSQSFVNHLALFFVAFLRENLNCLERADLANLWIEAHNYLAYLTLVDEREIFKGMFLRSEIAKKRIFPVFLTFFFP